MKLQERQSKISNIRELIQDLIFKPKDNEINRSDQVVITKHIIDHIKLTRDHLTDKYHRSIQYTVYHRTRII